MQTMVRRLGETIRAIARARWEPMLARSQEAVNAAQSAAGHISRAVHTGSHRTAEIQQGPNVGPAGWLAHARRRLPNTPALPLGAPAEPGTPGQRRESVTTQLLCSASKDIAIEGRQKTLKSERKASPVPRCLCLPIGRLGIVPFRRAAAGKAVVMFAEQVSATQPSSPGRLSSGVTCNPGRGAERRRRASLA
jgi:hypothetical protein